MDDKVVDWKGLKALRIPYTALQFNASPPDVISLVEFLARDFRRSKIEATLEP